MNFLLLTFGTLLALVSGARSVLWLTSYASSNQDQILAAASAIGMTAAMYLLSARAAMPKTTDSQKNQMNAAVTGLFLLSIFATFDWAESGYQAVTTRADTNSLIGTEYTSLLTDARAISNSQQTTADKFSDIGHLSKSSQTNKDATQTISTRRELLDDLQAHQSDAKPSTGSSAKLLGDYRLILWLLLATLLDWAGMLCLRTAVADQAQNTTPRPEKPESDPLLEQIKTEITTDQHGTQPAVKRVAEHHNLPTERVRPIFQQLVEQGHLIRSGIRYQRAPPANQNTHRTSKDNKETPWKSKPRPA